MSWGKATSRWSLALASTTIRSEWKRRLGTLRPNVTNRYRNPLGFWPSYDRSPLQCQHISCHDRWQQVQRVREPFRTFSSRIGSSAYFRQCWDGIPRLSLRLMHEVAKGMADLRGQGVLHGDLKAANNDRYFQSLHLILYSSIPPRWSRRQHRGRGAQGIKVLVGAKRECRN